MEKDNAKKEATRLFKDATPLLNTPNDLRELALKEGFLFFKSLISKRKLLQLRQEILNILKERQLLDERFPLEEGISDEKAVNQLNRESIVGVGIPNDLYRQIQKLESFHLLAHEPEILSVFKLLFAENPFPHPSKIARIMLPHKVAKATPPHQDFIHIQGSPNTWTTWLPLGDCSRELGGLSILAGSHREGVIDVTDHPGGAGGLESILCGYDYEWVEGDYELGDVILFHSHTVHRALPNQIKNKIRLSCDYRYQPESEPIDKGSLYAHRRVGDEDAWGEIYENWTNESIQYYWKDLKLRISDFDESIRWQKDKIC